MYHKKELCLESLKGGAACIVAFAWHYRHFRPESGSPFYALIPISFDYGWLMVDLFFMLSGFGMMTGYGDKILNREISFQKYFFRRISKLYPVFFFTLLLTTLLEFFYKARMGDTFVYPNFDIYHFVLNILCIQDGIIGTEWSFNAPSWSISVNLFCYALFFYLVFKSRQREEIIYRFAVAGAIGCSVMLIGINYSVFNILTGRGVFCFSIGVFLAEIYRKRDCFNCVMIGHVSFVIVLITYFVLRVAGPEVFGNLHMVFILLTAPLMVLCALFVPWLNKALQWRPLVYLGSLSIYIYLFHFPVQCLIRVADVYFDLHLIYSAKKVWLLYVIVVICVAAIYKKVSGKYKIDILKKLRS